MKKSTKIISLAMLIIMLFSVGVVAYAAEKEEPAKNTYSFSSNEEQLKLKNELWKKYPDMTQYEMLQIVFPKELEEMLQMGVPASMFSGRAFTSQESLSSGNNTSAASGTFSATCKGSRTAGSVSATATSTSSTVQNYITASCELFEQQPFTGDWVMAADAYNLASNAKTVSTTATRTTGYILRTHKGEGFHTSSEGDVWFSYSGTF